MAVHANNVTRIIFVPAYHLVMFHALMKLSAAAKKVEGRWVELEIAAITITVKPRSLESVKQCRLKNHKLKGPISFDTIEFRNLSNIECAWPFDAILYGDYK